MIRQGDVLLVPVAQIPQDAVPVARDRGAVVLAYGEATGHAHTLTEAGATLMESRGARYLSLSEPADLRHQEHTALPLAPGDYRVVIQREYNDAGEWVNVRD